MESQGQIKNQNEVNLIKENVENFATLKTEENQEYKIDEISDNIKKEQSTIDKTITEVGRIRKELGLEGNEINIPSIEVNKAKKSKFENVLNNISSGMSPVGKFAKVAALGAGLFVGGNNLEAKNFEKSNNLISDIENTINIEDEKNKTLNGGNIEEVVVYGKKKYEEELTKQQETIKKFESEMAKYQKDSAEWVKANEAYNDSLRAFNSMKEVDLLTDKYGISDPWNKSLRKSQDENSRLIHIKNNIKPVSYHINNNLKVPNPNVSDASPNKYSTGWGVYEYKKPTNEPIPPQKPENPANKEIKYDPKFEDLNMRSLWATLLKQDPNAKIGTLYTLDPQFEKGFTLEEAMTFPKEIKDQYNIDYIYNQIHGSEKSLDSKDYKHPGWDYNGPIEKKP